MITKHIAAGFGLALCIAVAACGKKEEAPAPKADGAKSAAAVTVVKIGVASPLTGPQAHIGIDIRNGVQLAVEDVNAQGVVIGGNKVKFELVAEDDEANPTKATTVAQKLVDAKVAGVVGHFNSGASIPASKIYSDAGIPADLAVIDQSQVHAAGLQDHLPRGRARRPAGSDAGPVRGREAESEEHRGHRRQHRLRPGPRRHVRGHRQVPRCEDRRARAHHRQGHRLQGDPDQDQGQQARPDHVRRHRSAGRPDGRSKWPNSASRPSSSAATACRRPNFIKLAGDAADGAMASMPGLPKDQMPGGKEFLEKYKAKFNQKSNCSRRWAMTRCWCSSKP